MSPDEVTEIMQDAARAAVMAIAETFKARGIEPGLGEAVILVTARMQADEWGMISATIGSVEESRRVAKMYAARTDQPYLVESGWIPYDDKAH